MGLRGKERRISSPMRKTTRKCENYWHVGNKNANELEKHLYTKPTTKRKKTANMYLNRKDGKFDRHTQKLNWGYSEKLVLFVLGTQMSNKYGMKCWKCLSCQSLDVQNINHFHINISACILENSMRTSR